MKRRGFVAALGRAGGLAGGLPLLRLAERIGPTARLAGPSLLIPMDDAQGDHLKAYGVTYRIVQAGLKAGWLLNHPGGAFPLPSGAAVRGDAALAAGTAEPVDG